MGEERMNLALALIGLFVLGFVGGVLFVIWLDRQGFWR